MLHSNFEPFSNDSEISSVTGYHLTKTMQRISLYGNLDLLALTFAPGDIEVLGPTIREPHLAGQYGLHDRQSA